MMDKLPLKLPSLFGVNEVVTLSPEPGLMSLGNEGEVTSNALLLLLILLMFTVDEPSFSIVKFFESVLLTSTSPKSSEPGFAFRVIVLSTPVPIVPTKSVPPVLTIRIFETFNPACSGEN